MTKDNLIIVVVTSMLLLGGFVVLFGSDSIPLNYTLEGESVRYGSKYNLLLVGMLPLITTGTLELLSKVHERYESDLVRYHHWLK